MATILSENSAGAVNSDLVSMIFQVHAPGRVNLIGEHIDYNLLPVFPIAIEKAIRIQAKLCDDNRVVLDSPAFGKREFELGPAIEPYLQGDWGNYAKAAAQALASRWPIALGFEGEVTGDIPIAAGLSSSSAMVVACALALLHANRIEFDRRELMDLLADGEHYVGTRGGGMDQAICLGGIAGHAIMIEFAPLRLHPTPVPRDWRFIVANSLVKAEKSAAVREAYNQRVKDCRDALAELPVPAASYRELLSRVSVPELLRMTEDYLDDRPRRRFRHVITEATRVLQARQAMLAADHVEFGRLLNESHRSLRDDYEVSHPEVDRLVALAVDAGAWGARITGAGFGGCIVAAVHMDRVDSVLNAIGDRFPAFAARASAGAAVVEQ